MPLDRQTPPPTLRAPHLAGALFLALITLLVSCREQERTPEWSESNPPAETVAPEPAPSPASPPDPKPAPERLVMVLSLTIEQNLKRTTQL